LILLGCTGSIGVNTLEIAKRFNLKVEVLVCGTNIKLLNVQLLQHSPKIVVVAKKEDISKVNHANVLYGEDAIIKAIEDSQSNLVVNALVGFLGLRPTISALACGKKVLA